MNLLKKNAVMPISERIPKYWFLDSSVALRIVAGLSEPAETWFARCLRNGEPLVASKLLELEVTRTLRRDGADLTRGEAVVGEVALLAVDDELVAEAAAIEPVIKSLDALHLATAQRLGVEHVTIVTHDKTMSRVAGELGFRVFDPVEP